MLKRMKQSKERQRDILKAQDTSEAMDKEVTRISREGIDSLLAFIKDQNMNYPVGMSVLMSIGANILTIPIQNMNDINLLQALKKEILETIVSLFDDAEQNLKQKMN